MGRGITQTELLPWSDLIWSLRTRSCVPLFAEFIFKWNCWILWKERSCCSRYFISLSLHQSWIRNFKQKRYVTFEYLIHIFFWLQEIVQSTTTKTEKTLQLVTTTVPRSCQDVQVKCFTLKTCVNVSIFLGIFF